MLAAFFQIFLAIYFCVSATSARQTADKESGQHLNKSAQQSIAPENETMGHPNPEIERLIQAFSGTWSIVLKVEPNEHSPKGGGGRGEEVWRPGPGRLSLIEEYHSTGADGELSGLGVAWWDKKAQRYQVMWCASSNAKGCIQMTHGATWESTQMVALHESLDAGKKSVFREVFANITKNSFTQTLYEGETANDLKRTVTITATRKTTSQPGRPDVFMPKSQIPKSQRLEMPGPAVQNSMLGVWSIALKYEPGPAFPNGATGEGTEVWWAGPGGYDEREQSGKRITHSLAFTDINPESRSLHKKVRPGRR